MSNGMPLHLRALSATERESAFDAAPSEYDAAVRQMQPATAYAIELNGVTSRATKVRFDKAAKRRGVRLRWAKTPTGLAVELANAPGMRNGG